MTDNANMTPEDDIDAAKLERLMEDVSRLPREIAPSRDAWPAIRQRIEEQRVRPIAGGGAAPRRRISPWWLGVAATLIVTAGTMWTVSQSKPVAGQAAADTMPAPLGGTSVPVVPVAELAAANPRLAAVVDQYQQATRELEAEVAARTAEMSPATREVVRRSLATIDTAIADLRSALGANPRDAAAGQSLPLVYERKIEFLKRVRSMPGTGM